MAAVMSSAMKKSLRPVQAIKKLRASFPSFILKQIFKKQGGSRPYISLITATKPGVSFEVHHQQHTTVFLSEICLKTVTETPGDLIAVERVATYSGFMRR